MLLSTLIISCIGGFSNMKKIIRILSIFLCSLLLIYVSSYNSTFTVTLGKGMSHSFSSISWLFLYSFLEKLQDQFDKYYSPTLWIWLAVWLTQGHIKRQQETQNYSPDLHSYSVTPWVKGTFVFVHFCSVIYWEHEYSDIAAVGWQLLMLLCELSTAQFVSGFKCNQNSVTPKGYHHKEMARVIR